MTRDRVQNSTPSEKSTSNCCLQKTNIRTGFPAWKAIPTELLRQEMLDGKRKGQEREKKRFKAFARTLSVVNADLTHLKKRSCTDG